MPPLLADEGNQEPAYAIPVLSGWARGTLVALAAGLVAVFIIAACLKPYDDHGQPLRMETHRQLGLPPCTFYEITKLPCPSCGMTTSFSWLMHGDVWNSLRANAVGTLLAAFCLAFIPWSLVCALWGRPFVVWSLERTLTRLIIVFLVLLLLRWTIVLAFIWGSGHPVPWLGKVGANLPAQSQRRDDGCTLETLALAYPDCGRHSRWRRLRPDLHAVLPPEPHLRLGR